MNVLNEIPVIWTSLGDEVVAVTPATSPVAGWTTLCSPELGRVLAKLSATLGRAADQVQVRTFTMRESDLSFWDSAVRKGNDGYSYGVVWSEDAKFLKNLQFKEVSPSLPQAPPVDPTMLAMAAALHQVQQTLARMEDQLDAIQVAVGWLEGRRQSRQAAELLTAITTLSSVGRRCLASGVVHLEDLLRIAHLEQVVGTVHREIAMELHAFIEILAFTNVESAKVARDLNSSRIADLIRLDLFALDGLATYQRLLLISKVARGRLAGGEVAEAKAELVRVADATTEVVKALRAIDTHMKDRSVWKYMSSSGYFKGKSDDNKLRKSATTKRSAAQAAAKSAGAQIGSFIESLESMDVLVLDRSAPLMLVSQDNVSA